MRYLFLIFASLLSLNAQDGPTFDFSGAGRTIPYRFREREPGTCAVSEIYKNTITGALRYCSAPNVWSDFFVAIGGPFVLDSSSALILTDIATPSNPSSGKTKFYSKNGALCSLSPGGVEKCTGSGSGSGATLPSTTNLIKCDGFGNGADTKVSLTAPATSWTIIPAVDNQTTTIPTGILVSQSDTGTVTNTMLAGGIGNGKLSNSSVTITPPSWLTGGAVSLGGSLTLTPTAAQTSHQFIGTCGSGTTFGPCSIVAGDIPTLNQNTTGTAANVTGVVAEANGGTGANNVPGSAGHVLRSNGTHYVDSAIQSTDIPTQYTVASCQPGLGDGINVIAFGTYLQTACLNTSGVTWTITSIRCFTDTGSSTLSVTNGSNTALLTGALTCSNSWASGTQSGTVTIASGDWMKFTFATDGTAKQAAFAVTVTR